MRNTPLGQVRSMVKAETGKSLNSTSTAQDAEINQLISNVQGQLAASYSWPFLKKSWDSYLTPSERFQTFPTTYVPQGGSSSTTGVIDFEHEVQIFVKWNNIWQVVIYGIDPMPEFNYLDSDRGMVLDPVQRWQFSDEGQFEVWPLPASTAQVRFVGQRQLTALVTGSTIPPTWNDAATCDLDDLLLVYHVAANYLLREGNASAQLLAKKANDHLVKLLGMYPTRTETVTMGLGHPMDRKAIRQVPLVLVGGK